MYCMKCGAEVPEDSNFCLKCGARVGEINRFDTPRLKNRQLMGYFKDSAYKTGMIMAVILAVLSIIVFVMPPLNGLNIVAVIFNMLLVIGLTWAYSGKEGYFQKAGLMIRAFIIYEMIISALATISTIITLVEAVELVQFGMVSGFYGINGIGLPVFMIIATIAVMILMMIAWIKIFTLTGRFRRSNETGEPLKISMFVIVIFALFGGIQVISGVTSVGSGVVPAIANMVTGVGMVAFASWLGRIRKNKTVPKDAVNPGSSPDTHKQEET